MLTGDKSYISDETMGYIKGAGVAPVFAVSGMHLSVWVMGLYAVLEELKVRKKIVILDDVISTGKSLESVEELVNKFDVDIVAKAAVLAEGDASDRKDIVFLEKLPLIFK